METLVCAPYLRYYHCLMILFNYKGNSPNCCSGSYNTPATCPSSGECNPTCPSQDKFDSAGLVTGVAYYSYFKNNCPDAYGFPFDEPSGTALWTCKSSLNADYTVTFCP